MGLLALRRAELLVIDRVVVCIKPPHHRAFVGRVVRHEEVTAVPEEHARRIEESVALKGFLHRPVEPPLPLGRGHVLHELAHGVLVAGRLPVVVVFVVEAHAVQQHRPALGIQMFGGQGRGQRTEQAATAHHPFPRQKGMLAP